MPHIILGRVPTGKCRCCGRPFFDTDSDAFIGRHNQECAQQYAERTHEARRTLDFLKPQDPEFADWLKTPAGRAWWRPSTKPV